MDEIKYRFVGGEAFISGVPARDLTAADVDGLTPNLRAAVKHSPLYEAVPEPKPAPRPRRRRAAEPQPEIEPTVEEPNGDAVGVAPFSWTANEEGE